MVIRTFILYIHGLRVLFLELTLTETDVPRTSYKINDARKRFAGVLERANQGEETSSCLATMSMRALGPLMPMESRYSGCCVMMAFLTTFWTTKVPNRLTSTRANGAMSSGAGAASLRPARAARENRARPQCRLLVDRWEGWLVDKSSVGDRKQSQYHFVRPVSSYVTDNKMRLKKLGLKP